MEGPESNVSYWVATAPETSRNVVTVAKRARHSGERC